MNDATATAKASASYRVYLKAWITLLVITLLMVVLATPAVLILGMCLKATIIVLWFMHLKYERGDFIFYIVASIAVFSLVLFGLIAPDGSVM